MAQEITTNSLVNGRSVCPGSRINFTCETRGSYAIAWSSEEYIGSGNAQLLFAAGASNVGDITRRNNLVEAEAHLTRNDLENGTRVLVSTLYITIQSNPPRATITCMHVGDGTEDTIPFQVTGKSTKSITIITLLIVTIVPATPGVPQDVFAIQIEHIENNCIVAATWQRPLNLVDSEVMNYTIYANDTNLSKDTVISGRTSEDTKFSSLLLIPGCFVHNVSVSAINICGIEGQQSDQVQLDPEMRFIVPNSTSESMTCDTGSGGKGNAGK